jgi:dethiobiotin synthetase
MRGLFVTGTDTGVGKTLVACAIARLLRQQGRMVRVCKPVATGAERVSGDTLALAEAAGDDPAAVTAWTFAEPAAPSVAARLAGVALRLEELAVAVRRRAAPNALLVVEGVGGLLCPLTDGATVADLAGDLGLPLVIVTRRSLGTLNHTLLTMEVARRRGLPMAGVVISATEPVRGVAEQTCAEELRSRLGVPVLAEVSWLADASPMAAAPALAGVDWWGLAGQSGIT